MKKTIRIISDSLIRELTEKARESKRLRTNYNFHEYEDVYQRFLNVLTLNTCIRPHKHSKPPKAESFIVLKGSIGFLIYNEQGEVIEKYYLSSDGPDYGIDIGPDIWHAAVCISDTAVCFEGKTGPYDPNEDKIFAGWAPKEEDFPRENYLSVMKSNFNL